MKIGEKIKHLRVQKNLTQEELADRAELSKGFISQLERDLTSPSISTLVDILQCLGTNLKAFFSDFDDKQVVFKKTDYFIKQDNELKNEIQWIIPNAQKNEMEPILLNLETGGSTWPDNPHEGEEFGYVLNGTITIHIGNVKHKVRKGESFYYVPNKTHYIVNSSQSASSILWVSSPPSF
ncbi:MAG: transcriptional regulator, family [Clostridiales bacterium]|jgi:transcriptional regulator with XRE-family HTH domain|nr:transcriptional regulator, family [Clostridiales bacterium]